ncbi:MAG: Bd3614 family nucleic acid deaminase [Pseudomonadota bacterium]
MPTIHVLELVTYMAHTLKAGGGRDIAIGTTGTGVILAVEIDDRRSPRDFSTAIVNLLQNNNGIRIENICSTYRPTEACMGMAKLRQVKLLVYVGADGRLLGNGLVAAPPWIAKPVPLPARNSRTWIAFEIDYKTTPEARAAVLIKNATASPGAALKKDWNADIKPIADIWRSVQSAVPRGRHIPPKAIPIPLVVGTSGPFTFQREKVFMTLAHAIAAARTLRWHQSRHAKQIDQAGYAIGALLVRDDGTLAGASLNNHHTNETYHAEAQLVMQDALHNAGGLPAYSRLYTTLQCCHMCAGLIASAGVGVRVWYGQVDNTMCENALQRNVQSCWETHFDETNVGQQMEVVRISNATPKQRGDLKSAAAADTKAAAAAAAHSGHSPMGMAAAHSAAGYLSSTEKMAAATALPGTALHPPPAASLGDTKASPGAFDPLGDSKAAPQHAGKPIFREAAERARLRALNWEKAKSITGVLDSLAGGLIAMESIYRYRALERSCVMPAERALWVQGSLLINQIFGGNLVLPAIRDADADTAAAVLLSAAEAQAREDAARVRLAAATVNPAQVNGVENIINSYL